jgi:hypothetical protein
LPPELEEPRSGQRPGQPVVAQQPPNVQVFDHDLAVALGQLGRQLVQVVAADGGDLGVVAGQPAGGTVA